MDSLLTAFFCGLIVIAAHQTSTMLAAGAQDLLVDRDTAVLNQSCRTDFDETKRRRYKFSGSETIPCLFQRTDYAAPGTRGFWPTSICSILQESSSSHLSDGTSQCNFQ